MNKIVTILVAAMFFLVSATYSQASLTISPTTVTGNTGETVTVSLVVNDFTDIVSMQYGIKWDPAVIQFEAVENFNLTDLSANSFNSTDSPNGFLAVAWFDNAATGVSVPDGEAIFTMNFTVLGDASSGSQIVFEGRSSLPIEVANAANGVITDDIIFTDAQFGDPNGNDGGNNSGNTAPLVSAISNASGDNGTTICVDVSVANFTDITAMDYSLNWDAAVLQFNEIRNISLAGLSQSSFGTSTSTNGQLSVNWANAAGATAPDGNIYQACFNLIGAAGTSSTVSFSSTPTPINVTTTASTTSVGITQTNGTVSVNNVTPPPTTPPTTPPSTGTNLINIGSVDAEAGSTVCVPVTVNDFDGIASLQFSLQWDPAVLQFTEVRNLNIPDLSASSFNTTQSAAGQAAMAWFDNTAQGVTLADGSVIFEMCFTVLGASGTASSIVFTDSPTQREAATSGNTITFTETNGSVSVDGGTVTPPTTPPTSTGDALINISAMNAPAGSTVCVPVTVNDFNGIASLQFSLQWDPAVLQFAEVRSFNLPDLNANSFNTTNVANGQTAMAWFDNSAQGVTLADGSTLFEMCFTVLGTNGNSSSIVFTDTPTQREAATADNTITFTETNGSVTVGEGTVNPPVDTMVTPPPTGTGDALVNIAGLSAEPGSTICVPVTVNDFDAIASLQFSLAWDPAVLQFAEVRNFNLPDLNANSFNTVNVASGQTAMAWFDNSAQGVTLADGATLFEICFTVLGANGTNSTIVFADVPTVREAATADNTIEFTESNGAVTVETVITPPPTTGDPIINIAAISAEEGGTICVPITAMDFDGIASMQFSLAWDPAVLQFSTTQGFGLPDLSANSFNIDGTATGQLAVAWFDQAAQGITLADVTVIFEVCFDVIGAVGANTAITFTDVPTTRELATASGTIDFLSSDGTITVTEGDPPPPPVTGEEGIINIGDITGDAGTSVCIPITVKDFDGIASMQFSLAWDPTVLQFTGVGESFGLPDLNANSFNVDGTTTGQLAVAWFDQAAQGITLADGTVIFEVCFDIIGAEGASTNITFTDVPTTRELATADATIPFSSADGTFTVAMEEEPVDTTTPPVMVVLDKLVNIAPVTIEMGTAFCVPVVVSDFDGIASLQFSLKWDPTVIEFTGLGSTFGLPDLNANGFNIGQAANGELGVAWFDQAAQGITLEDGTALFEVCFNAIGSDGASTSIEFSDVPTVREAANANNTIDFTQTNGTVTIGEDDPPPPTCPVGITAVATPTNVSCNGLSDGAITLAVSGGDGTYTYQWSDASIGNIPNPTGLAAGVYSVTITSCNGAEIKSDIPAASLTITEPTAIVSVITPEDASCFGVADGRINVSVSGGVAPYTYVWSDATLSPANRPVNAAAGTYSLTITDASNCTSIANGITVSGPTEMVATVATTPASCSGLSDGTATITLTGGAAPYTYSWNVAGVTGANPANLAGGDYIVTIADANQCSITVPVTITNAVTLSADVQVVEDACGDNSGAIQITPRGGAGPYTIGWSGPVSIPNNTITVENLPTGIYFATITDASGCFYVETIEVGGPTATLSATGTVTDIDCPGDNNGMINLLVAGGFEPYTFAWTNGATTQNLANLTPGGYTVTITDNKVCTYTQTFIIGTRSNMEVSVEVTKGAPNAEATATVTGGVEPYTYEWCNGQMGQSATDLDEGNCSLTVIDALGCTVVQNFEIVVDNPVATITSVTPISCSGLADGSLQVNVAGGKPDYSYTWSNGGTTSTIANVGAGNYSVTVTDASGNEGLASFDLSEPTPIIIDLSESITPSCDNDGVISISVSGGTMPYKEIKWSNDVMGLRNEGLRAGEYGVIVTDQNDCTAEENFRVLNDEQCKPCYMSNKVVTPNDDGRNDAFCISCVDMAANNHLEIYNRWGQLVFEADNYECVLGTESDCWKGLTRTNNLVDEGGYFWILEYDDGSERKRIRDHVTILRDN